MEHGGNAARSKPETRYEGSGGVAAGLMLSDGTAVAGGFAGLGLAVLAWAAPPAAVSLLSAGFGPGSNVVMEVKKTPRELQFTACLQMGPSQISHRETLRASQICCGCGTSGCKGRPRPTPYRQTYGPLRNGVSFNRKPSQSAQGAQISVLIMGWVVSFAGGIPRLHLKGHSDPGISIGSRHGPSSG